MVFVPPTKTQRNLSPAARQGGQKSNTKIMNSNSGDKESLRQGGGGGPRTAPVSPVSHSVSTTKDPQKLLGVGEAEFPTRRHSMPKMKSPPKTETGAGKSEPSWRKASSRSASALPVQEASGKKRRCPAKVRIISPAAAGAGKGSPGKVPRPPTPPPLLGKLPVSPVKITISPESPESPESPPPLSPGQFRRYELRRLMDIFIHAATSSGCSCASNLKIVEAQCARGEPEVEVSWDDLERRCTDFGISDYLSTSLEQGNYSEDPGMAEEILEHVPDFDSGESLHWLSATPPQRFSDPDLDNIEPLPVTLDTILNFRSEKSEELPEAHQQVIDSVFENGGEEDDLATLNLDNFRHPPKSMGRSSSRDEGGNGPGKIPSAAPSRPCPRRLSRQISLPSRLFTDLYVKSRERGPQALNFRLNKQESLSESFKTRLLHQLDSLSIGSSEGLSVGSPAGFSINSSWESSFFPRNGDGDEPMTKVKDNFDLPPFSSDLEKRAIMVRNIRHLIRQDTFGNFAPPDFCI